MKCSVAHLLISIGILILICKNKAEKPNIVLILLDDVGWNDVGFHGSTQVSTPNIDLIARSGTVLHRHYAQEMCSPTRAALMTGKYPHHVGLHEGVIGVAEQYGLPLGERLLPEFLKDLGYKTHMVGKWHLGFLNESYLPSRRGFDTFYGSYNSGLDYWDHTVSSTELFCVALDLHFDYGTTQTIVYEEDTFLSELYKNRAIEVIKKEAEASEPFFLYYAAQGVHTPFDPPEEYYELFEDVREDNRRNYLAHLKYEDDAIGEILAQLEESGVLDNTIIVFSSDNRGSTTSGTFPSSYPLRGTKKTLFEGGVRVAAAIAGPLISSERTFEGIMHVSDWLPTLYAAAGGTDSLSQWDLDGINFWNALTTENINKARDELLVGYTDELYAMIIGDYKYVNSAYLLLTTYALYQDDKYSDEDQATEIDGWNLPLIDCGDNVIYPCLQAIGDDERFECLFDLANDPCEKTNLADINEEIVEFFQERIKETKKGELQIKYSIADDDYCPKDSGAWGVFRH